MGKTFLLRLLLLICALDLAGARSTPTTSRAPATSSRWPRSRTATGPATSPRTSSTCVADMRALRTEMRRRTKVIRELDENRCPENKVTPELASDPRLGLHPIAIAWDECQIPFEHPEYGKELIAIATDLTKRGPALGIMLMLATQRPDANSIPTGDQRERRAADVPEGDGPGRERHGAGHLDVQERHPGHDVRPR